jgi:hypothetical protein
MAEAPGGNKTPNTLLSITRPNSRFDNPKPPQLFQIKNTGKECVVSRGKAANFQKDGDADPKTHPRPARNRVRELRLRKIEKNGGPPRARL